MTRGAALNDLPVTIRLAAPNDAAALRRLAQLDSASILRGHVLLAETDGVPIGAISLRLVPDPGR
jgi:hypothetical protein